VIPDELWDDLRAAQLIRDDAPTPSVHDGVNQPARESLPPSQR
jgi:hypothetical protein